MKVAVRLDYKPTRYEGKGFLRNLNIRIHRDITGDRCGVLRGMIAGWTSLDTRGSLSVTFCSNAY